MQPFSSRSFVVTDDTDHESAEDIGADSVGDVQAVDDLPAQVDKHHQDDLKINNVINKMSKVHKSHKMTCGGIKEADFNVVADFLEFNVLDKSLMHSNLEFYF